jgi:methyl-accepting chemotaxis protein
MNFQAFALVVIAISALIVAISFGLLFKRMAGLIDEAKVTLQTINQMSPKLERLIDEIDEEIEAVRAITARFRKMSERIESVTEEVAGTVQQIFHPIKRLSGTIGVLGAVIRGVAAGAAALRRDGESGTIESDEPTSNRPGVGKRSAR